MPVFEPTVKAVVPELMVLPSVVLALEPRNSVTGEQLAVPLLVILFGPVMSFWLGGPASENPTWGAPRIHGELKMLGYDISALHARFSGRLGPEPCVLETAYGRQGSVRRRFSFSRKAIKALRLATSRWEGAGSWSKVTPAHLDPATHVHSSG
jgi:hypothetical protein